MTPFSIDLSAKPKLKRMAGRAFVILDWSVDLAKIHEKAPKPTPAFAAYLSVGEIAPDAPYLKECQEKKIKLLGKNPAWGSFRVDPSDQAWCEFLVNKKGKEIADKGFAGFFLDTVDVTEDLAAKYPDRKDEFREGMANIIQQLKVTWPNLKIISNRGFEIFPLIHSFIDGFLLESLFQTKSKKGWKAVPEDESAALLQRLAPVKAATKVYVIDYCDPGKPKVAKQTAERIAALGFSPLIVAKSLDGTVLAP